MFHSLSIINTAVFVEFEVVTKVVMKSFIFWHITPCSPLKVNRRFGGTYHPHLQSRRISRAENQRESRWQADLTFNGLHGVISQMIVLFTAIFLGVTYFLAYFPYFEKNSRLMRSFAVCVCVRVCVTPLLTFNARNNLYET
jgi:hypothetical protein